MPGNYIESLRAKLYRRHRRLMEVEFNMVHGEIKRFFDFAFSQHLILGIFNDLQVRNPTAVDVARKIVEEKQGIDVWGEQYHVATCLAVLLKCRNSDDAATEINIGEQYIRHMDHSVHIQHFRAHFIRPLCDYLEEQIDEQTAMLGLLTSYKQKCEWFHRQRLYDLWSADASRGEDRLAFDLYDFLLDQGVNLTIESRSVSGRADLIASQTGRDPVLADIKIFGDKTSRSYLAAGVHQVYQYTCDHNYPFGYLVVFNVSDKNLHFALPHQELVTPFLIHNHKTIFLHLIDLRPDRLTASKLGSIEQFEITKEQLLSDFKGPDGEQG